MGAWRDVRNRCRLHCPRCVQVTDLNDRNLMYYLGVIRTLGGTGVAIITVVSSERAMFGVLFQRFDPKTIAIQTFIIIWRLENPRRGFWACVIGIEALFLILSVAIAFGVHTHPPNEYFAAPAPVWHFSRR